MKTTIKAKKDLYNHGLCFKENGLYEVNGDIKTTPALMERAVINEMGEDHIIGSWWREFVIVNN